MLSRVKVTKQARPGFEYEGIWAQQQLLSRNKVHGAVKARFHARKCAFRLRPTPARESDRARHQRHQIDATLKSTNNIAVSAVKRNLTLLPSVGPGGIVTTITRISDRVYRPGH